MKYKFLPVFLLTVLLCPQLLLANKDNLDFQQLLERAEYHIDKGHLLLAQEQILASYDQSVNDYQRAQTYLLSSQIHFQNGDLIKAKTLLDQVLDLNDPLLAAQANIQLGRIHHVQQKFEQAALAYQQAAAHSNLEISSIAKINLSRLSDKQQASDLLLTAYKQINLLKDNLRKQQLLIFLVQQSKNSFPAITWRALQELSSSKALKKHPRLYSQLFGYQSHLYFQQRKYNDALALIQRAIFIAQEEPDLLILWEWQQGKILTSIDKNAALAAYRRAESHLQKIRDTIPVRYIDGRSSYREMLSPLYMEYTKLLLQLSKNDNSKTASNEQNLLNEAQRVIETLKRAELQDYFKNFCAVEQQPLIDLTARSPQTAFIYPIVFEDSLEILLGINNQLRHYSIDVNQRQLHRVIRRAMSRIRPTADGSLKRFGRNEIKKLYSWLIKPLEKDLQQQNIDTLVFIPDGMLRLVPASILWDGKQYLIEKYAIATLSGITLLDPQPLSRKSIQGKNILLAGLSKPGNVVKKLPNSMKRSLVNQDSLASLQRQISMRFLPAPAMITRDLSRGGIFETTPNNKPLVLRQQQLEQIQNSLELPGVKTEIEMLSKIANTQGMMNENFQLDSFRQKSKAAQIIHIASHGMFTGEPESSFIMTHDRLLDMNVLADLFKTGSNSDKPVELLVLSACQTAEGDDRSPLGLAGVALQSGARSILGSLWPVSDDAAKTIFPEFYTRLREDELLSKAKALQFAQIELIHSKEMGHPFYWAPFILIGNWY